MSNSADPSESSDHELPAEPTTAPAPQTRLALQVLLIIALVIGVALGVWALYRLASIVLVLVLATLLAYVIEPLVRLAQWPVRVAGRSRHLPRGTAIALVYVLLAGGASGAAVLLLPGVTQQLDDIAAGAPAYTQSIVTWEQRWTTSYQRLRIPLEVRERIDQSVLAATEATVASARGTVLVFATSFASALPWLVLIPILAFFLLKDAASVRRMILVALPHRVQLRWHRFFEDLNATAAAFVRAQLLACLLVGSACGLGFTVLGIPYSGLLGVLAGVLEFIPLVGPLLLTIVAAVVSALHAPILVYRVLGFIAVVRVVEDYVVYPRLIGRRIHIHPLAVILAVLSGAELAGVAGMFLAVPVVAVASVAHRHWLEWRLAQS